MRWRALQLGVYGSCLDHVLWSVREGTGKCRAGLAEGYFSRRQLVSYQNLVHFFFSRGTASHSKFIYQHHYIMSPSALSALLAVAAASVVLAQPDPADPTPLYSKIFAYPTGIVRPSFILLSLALIPRLAVSGRLQHRCHPRTPNWVQHLQLHNREPGFTMPDGLCQPHRWYIYLCKRCPLH